MRKHKDFCKLTNRIWNSADFKQILKGFNLEENVLKKYLMNGMNRTMIIVSFTHWIRFDRG